jgi:hypothetical protein
MRRRRSAIALAAATALAFAAPAAAGGSRFPLGDFAGYVWRAGPLDALSATFTVPRIRMPSPPRSIAATWIGAQAPGVTGPFIQIGINELHATVSLDVYYAFWSDTTLQFHPRFLFTVRAGDVIAASLRHLPDGWALAIVDATTRVARRFTSPDEAAGAFELAEFLQEDPTNSAHAELPYPRLAGGRFRQLRVNSATPARGTLLSQWMSNGHGYVAPSALAGDAFALHPTKLTSAVARYLRLIAPTDLELEAYDNDVASWTATTPRSVVAAASAAAAQALRMSIPALVHGPWPPRARGAVDVLVARERALVRVVDAAASSPDLLRWRLGYRSAAAAVGHAGAKVRRRLHGPAYNL